MMVSVVMYLLLMMSMMTGDPGGDGVHDGHGDLGGGDVHDGHGDLDDGVHDDRRGGHGDRKNLVDNHLLPVPEILFVLLQRKMGM